MVVTGSARLNVYRKRATGMSARIRPSPRGGCRPATGMNMESDCRKIGKGGGGSTAGCRRGCYQFSGHRKACHLSLFGPCNGCRDGHPQYSPRRGPGAGRAFSLPPSFMAAPPPSRRGACPVAHLCSLQTRRGPWTRQASLSGPFCPFVLFLRASVSPRERFRRSPPQEKRFDRGGGKGVAEGTGRRVV